MHPLICCPDIECSFMVRYTIVLIVPKAEDSYAEGMFRGRETT